MGPVQDVSRRLRCRWRGAVRGQIDAPGSRTHSRGADDREQTPVPHLTFAPRHRWIFRMRRPPAPRTRGSCRTGAPVPALRTPWASSRHSANPLWYSDQHVGAGRLLSSGGVHLDERVFECTLDPRGPLGMKLLEMYLLLPCDAASSRPVGRRSRRRMFICRLPAPGHATCRKTE